MRARGIILPTLGLLRAASIYSEEQRWSQLELVNSVVGKKGFQDRDANAIRKRSSNLTG